MSNSWLIGSKNRGKIEGDSWFTWWFIQLRGTPIYFQPKWAPTLVHLLWLGGHFAELWFAFGSQEVDDLHADGHDHGDHGDHGDHDHDHGDHDHEP